MLHVRQVKESGTLLMDSVPDRIERYLRLRCTSLAVCDLCNLRVHRYSDTIVAAGSRAAKLDVRTVCCVNPLLVPSELCGQPLKKR